MTLSTVGYGDITPLTLQARYAAVAEAITGQFYLAILVVRLVGMQMAGAGRWQESSPCGELACDGKIPPADLVGPLGVDAGPRRSGIDTAPAGARPAERRADLTRAHGTNRPGVAAVLAGALVAATLLGGCERRARPNVLLVTVDTLRAERLGAYGFGLAHTPAIDALAREGVRCTDVASAARVAAAPNAGAVPARGMPAAGKDGA